MAGSGDRLVVANAPPGLVITPVACRRQIAGDTRLLHQPRSSARQCHHEAMTIDPGELLFERYAAQQSYQVLARERDFGTGKKPYVGKSARLLPSSRGLMAIPW